MAPYFKHCVFSCDLGVVKPDARTYRAALEALDLQPGEALFVGDGSDEELSGAKLVGIQSVLVSVALSNTYDPKRSDLETWIGPSISRLSEVSKLV